VLVLARLAKEGNTLAYWKRQLTASPVLAGSTLRMILFPCQIPAAAVAQVLIPTAVHLLAQLVELDTSLLVPEVTLVLRVQKVNTQTVGAQFCARIALSTPMPPTPPTPHAWPAPPTPSRQMLALAAAATALLGRRTLAIPLRLAPA
jgi:hypothetical protein